MLNDEVNNLQLVQNYQLTIGPKMINYVEKIPLTKLQEVLALPF